MSIKTIGLLGGGQLGRMSAMAAARLGIQAHIFTPETNSPAAQVSAQTFVADYSDETALREFANSVDVISYEFENIPVKTIQFLKTIKPVFPDEKLLEISQDRLIEKSYLNSINIPTTRFKKLKTSQCVSQCYTEWDSDQVIIKTARFGYDGKGQVKCRSQDNIEEIISELSGDLIIEEIVDFECEISLIAARNTNGQIEVYGPMLNEHKNHILHLTTFPALLADNIQNNARDMVIKLSNDIELVGVLTLELFLTKDGNLLANEIAPRTHNSGHWTIDTCNCSQFENHVRAVCGLPLGSAEAHSNAKMLNLIGDDVLHSHQYLKEKNACLHLYGKHDVREGRKMGHVTFLKQGE